MMTRFNTLHRLLRNATTPSFLGALVLVPIFLLSSCSRSSSGGGDDGDGGGGPDGDGDGPPTPPVQVAVYDIGLRTIRQGLQAGRPFSLRVDFLMPGTEDPAPVPDTEVVTAALLDGASGEPVAALGTASPTEGGDTFVVLEGLLVQDVGDYTIEVTGPLAAEATSTNRFTVGSQLDFAVEEFPTDLLVGEPFALEVQVVDPSTGESVAPGYPVDVTVAFGSIDDAFSATLDPSSSSVTLSGAVPDPESAEAVIAVSAFGFPTLESGPITLDEILLRGLQRGGSPLVRGFFTVQGERVLESTGVGVGGTAPIFASIALAPGAEGALVGNTAGLVATDGSFIIGPLSYSADDDIVLTVTSPGAMPVGLMASFAYELDVVAEGPTTVVGSETVGPFSVRFEDAFGGRPPLPLSPLSWSVTRDVDGTVTEVATGTSEFEDLGAGDARAVVAPAGFTELGDYQLTITGGPEPRTLEPAVLDFSVENDTIGLPGPFVALQTARVGSMVMSEGLAGAVVTDGMVTGATGPAFGLLGGELPPGLAIDPTTGGISGQPTAEGDYTFTAYARVSDTSVQPIRASLAVFTADESELVGTSFDFRALGSLASGIEVFDDTWTFTSSFDDLSYQTAARIWAPPASEGAAPVLVFHRGRNVSFTAYDNFARHLASWGIAVVSVEDFQSFDDGSGRAPDMTYDTVVPQAGMQSGAAFLEAAAERMAERTVLAGDELNGRIDVSAVFYGGHGYGGGSAQAAHHRFLTNQARGYVYLMPLDLRAFAGTEPPGVPQGTAAYPIAEDQPVPPQLIVAAENDTEVIFPIADQLHERRTGASTMVTVYGGCNSFQTDDLSYDAPAATITRAAQQAETWHYVTAFVRRYSGAMSRELDTVLYRNETAALDTVAMQSWRNTAETILIDDFQDMDLATNRLGGLNVLTDGVISEESIYPGSEPGFTTLNIRQSVASLSGIPDSTYSAAFLSLDASSARRVAMRLGQTTSIGFDWVTVRLRLIDGFGTSATVTVWDAVAQTGRLPDYDPAGTNPYDRFLDLQVAFDEFDSTLDVADLRRVELVFETDGAVDVSRRIFLDNLRLE